MQRLHSCRHELKGWGLIVSVAYVWMNGCWICILNGTGWCLFFRSMGQRSFSSAKTSFKPFPVMAGCMLPPVLPTASQVRYVRKRKHVPVSVVSPYYSVYPVILRSPKDSKWTKQLKSTSWGTYSSLSFMIFHQNWSHLYTSLQQWVIYYYSISSTSSSNHYVQEQTSFPAFI